MNQFLRMLFLFGLLLITSSCEKKDERVLPKLGSTDQSAQQAGVIDKSSVERDEFIRQAQMEVDGLIIKLADLRKQAVAATGKAKTKLDQQILTLEREQKDVEEKLAKVKSEIGEKWKELQVEVTEAIGHFKQSLKNAI